MNGPLKVLVVEDNPALLKMIRRHLERNGFNTRESRSGDEALSMVQDAQPDIILLDMNLPGKNGWSVATELRSGRSTQQLPIIGVTAHAMPGDRERVIQAGCDDYVSKPIDFGILIKIMHRLIQQQANDDLPPPRIK